MLSKTGLQIT